MLAKYTSWRRFICDEDWDDSVWLSYRILIIHESTPYVDLYLACALVPVRWIEQCGIFFSNFTYIVTDKLTICTARLQFDFFNW